MKTNYKNYNRGKREETKPVDEVSEEVKETKQVIGVVSNCERLNIRKIPRKDADVLCILEVGSEVTVVDLRIDTTSEFYKVITGAGIEGYCMKEFIEVDE